eukprot:664874_1
MHLLFIGFLPQHQAKQHHNTHKQCQWKHRIYRHTQCTIQQYKMDSSYHHNRIDCRITSDETYGSLQSHEYRSYEIELDLDITKQETEQNVWNLGYRSAAIQAVKERKICLKNERNNEKKSEKNEK